MTQYIDEIKVKNYNNKYKTTSQRENQTIFIIIYPNTSK